MAKPIVTKEQVLATWEKTREASKRLSDAKAKAESLPGKPDMAALQIEIDAFRSRHAEEKKKKEYEFSCAQHLSKWIASTRAEVTSAQKAFDAARKQQAHAEKNYIS